MYATTERVVEGDILSEALMKAQTTAGDFS